MNSQVMNLATDYTSEERLDTAAVAANDQTMQFQEVVPLEYRLNAGRIDLEKVERQARAARANWLRSWLFR
ncbi:hypothetical protein SAMN05660443_1145 [Marinospirillum celere]|uniref:Uncharacterized protein n=1 Tax=Marinospirillum celere TaxID=1122252 RepID=A0A1I1FPY2_9GAMM|nr:hypothetical protein [Marinospirillum celere]SFC01507.1 hypothetical protein SAMN05660443_1145 [Marinospirillum celere]